jgi:hypothetical protein
MRGGGVVALFVAGCGRLAFDPLGGSGATVDSAVGDGATGDAAFACVQQGFEAQLTADWNLWNTPGFSTNVTGGVLRILLQANSGGYAGISKDNIDLTGGYALAEVLQTSQGNNTETYLQIAQSATSNDGYIVSFDGANLSFLRRLNDVNDMTTSVPFNPVQHRWWKIEHVLASAEVVMSTSTDGLTWTPRFTVPAAVPLTTALIEVAAGELGGGNASPGTPQFDNFTYCLP